MKIKLLIAFLIFVGASKISAQQNEFRFSFNPTFAVGESNDSVFRLSEFENGNLELKKELGFSLGFNKLDLLPFGLILNTGMDFKKQTFTMQFYNELSFVDVKGDPSFIVNPDYHLVKFYAGVTKRMMFRNKKFYADLGVSIVSRKVIDLQKQHTSTGRLFNPDNPDGPNEGDVKITFLGNRFQGTVTPRIDLAINYAVFKNVVLFGSVGFEGKQSIMYETRIKNWISSTESVNSLSNKEYEYVFSSFNSALGISFRF